MKRTRTIGAKVTPAEHAELHERAAAVAMTPSDYLRAIAFADPIALRLLNLFVQTTHLALRNELDEQRFLDLVAGVDISPRRSAA